MRQAPTVRDSRSTEGPGLLKRRGVLLGSGVAAVAGAVAVLASRSLPVPVAAEPVAGAPPADALGGYRLSKHVQRYYETARV